MNWYLLQTKSNSHKIACDHLRRQGFHVFLPLIQTTTKKRGKYLDKTTPLFGNYLFIGSTLDQIPWKSINATRGISRAVTFDGNYYPIETKIIEGIKCRCDRSGIIMKMDNILPGDRAKIERGPFTEFICNVEKITRNQRACVLISLANRPLKANISLSDVSKLT